MNTGNIIGYHRIGNTLLNVTKPRAIAVCAGLGGVYSWRLFEGYNAFKHDRKFPEEPKELTTSWFLYQMGLEAGISTFILPIAMGQFAYNGPVPIPKEDYRKSVFQPKAWSFAVDSDIKKDYQGTSLRGMFKNLPPLKSLFKFRF